MRCAPWALSGGSCQSKLQATPCAEAVVLTGRQGCSSMRMATSDTPELTPFTAGSLADPDRCTVAPSAPGLITPPAGRFSVAVGGVESMVTLIGADVVVWPTPSVACARSV